MRCGICGKDTMLGYHLATGRVARPIYGVSDLNHHKAMEHPTEYSAAIAARRTKAQATRQAQAAEAQRVSDARLAASRPVVIRQRGEGETTTRPSSEIRRWELSVYQGRPNTDVRFPDAGAYAQYLGVMVTIAGLEAKARMHLTRAWEMGTPVTLEHLDELDRAAIALASPQTKEDEA